MAIASIADQGTQDIWDGTASKAARKTLPHALHRTAQRRLDMLDAATDLFRDLGAPGLHLKTLGGDRKGSWSIRINDQYRVVFRFADGNAHDVRITDYH